MSVAQTIAGCEVVAIIRKGQVVSAPANDMKGQTDFISALLSATASPAHNRLSHDLSQDLQHNLFAGVEGDPSPMIISTGCLRYDAPSGNEGGRSSDHDVKDATHMLVGYL